MKQRDTGDDALPPDERSTCGSAHECREEEGMKLFSCDTIPEPPKTTEPNMHSITLRLTFRHPDRTLTSEELDREMEKIVGILEARFDVRVRKL